MKSHDKKTDGRIMFLESIRGIAALIVVLGHLLSAFFPAAAVTTKFADSHSHIIERLFHGLPLGFLIAGHFAVLVFFVLSGFVLSIGYFQKKDSRIITSLALRRYFRLGIPVFLSVIVGYVTVKSGLLFAPDINEKTGFFLGGNPWPINPTLLEAFHDGLFGALVFGNVSYNPVLWTMHFELLGSIVVFGFIALFGNLRRRWFLYAVAFFLSWNTYMFPFIAGVGLADAYFHKQHIFTKRWTIRTGLIILTLVVASIPTAFLGEIPSLLSYITPSFIKPFDSLLFWQGLGAIALLYVALGWPRAHRILEHKSLAWLGKISFGLYLTHYIILASLSSFLFIKINTFDYRLDSFIVIAISIPVMLGVAALWTKYVDRFALDAGRWFERWVRNEPVSNLIHKLRILKKDIFYAFKKS